MTDGTVWSFDRLDRVGGHKTTVEGAPRVIDTAVGKAVEFDGVDDALFVDVHPLAGAKVFTWEAIFRPDGGSEAQRWFHLQESASDNRLLFELRVLEGKWYFDSYLHSDANQKALIDKTKVHPLLAWYHVAAVYDGREFRNYVNGVQEGAAEIHFDAQGSGRSSIGVRINKVYYFKGAIHTARFTPRALRPAEFLKLTGAWNPVSFPAPDGVVVQGDLYGKGDRGVVLAHGGRFDKASWSEQAYALMKAGFRVLAVNLRFDGHAKDDVLGAVRYLRRDGAKTISIVGASFGGDAAAEVAVEAPRGEIDRLVLLAHSPIDAPERMQGRKLFIVARDDANAAGPRLPGIQNQYERASDPKELIVLDGDAHAQFLFATDQRERVTRDILRFLSKP